MNQDQQLRVAAKQALAALESQNIIGYSGTIRRLRAALTATQHAAPSQGVGERKLFSEQDAASLLLAADRAEWLANTFNGTQEQQSEVIEKLHDYAATIRALLEASAQREQPAASKSEPQAQAGGYTSIERLIKWNTAMADEPNRNEAKRLKHRETAITLQAMREAIAKKDAALKAQNEALNAVDQEIDLTKYAYAPPNVTLLDVVKDAITQGQEALK